MSRKQRIIYTNNRLAMLKEHENLAPCRRFDRKHLFRRGAVVIAAVAAMGLTMNTGNEDIPAVPPQPHEAPPIDTLPAAPATPQN